MISKLFLRKIAKNINLYKPIKLVIHLFNQVNTTSSSVDVIMPYLRFHFGLKIMLVIQGYVRNNTLVGLHLR